MLPIVLFFLLLKPLFSSASAPTLTSLLNDKSSQVKLSSDTLNHLNSHWVSQAFSGLMSSLANEKLRESSSIYNKRHTSSCLKLSTNIQMQANCLVTLANSQRRRGLKTRRSKRSLKGYNVVQKDNYRMTSVYDDNPMTTIFDKLGSSLQVIKGRVIRGKRWQRLISRIRRNRLLNQKYTPEAKPDHRSEPPFNRILRDSVSIFTKLNPLRNKTANENNVRFLSPRLFDITGESKQNTENEFLSPSILPLYGKDKGYSAFTGFLAEATGLADILEDSIKKAQAPYMEIGGEKMVLSRKELKSMYGRHGYAQMNHMEKFHSSYNQKQLKDFKEQGYTVMTPAQGRFMYGRNSPFEDRTAFEATQSISARNVKRKLFKSVQQLSKYPGNFSRRAKDSVLSPVLLSLTLNKFTIGGSTVLSPVLLNPRVLSPTIFGAVILSPWVFAPSILTPRVFAPVILSPRLMCPLILSPHFFNPHVLSPGVLNPRILSPFFATPFILSPQVMSPAVLSPYALSPSVLNPRHLSPAVLSPALLSPVVSSPMSSGFVLLSPAVLSPKFNSTPIDTPVIASPSILS